MTTITIRAGYVPVTIGRGTMVHVARESVMRTACGTAANNPSSRVRRAYSAAVTCTKCLVSNGVVVSN